MKGFFVTGTDTDCGKTHVARLLLAGLRAQGRRVAGFKPVAAGARMTSRGLRNADAEYLRKLSDVEAPYEVFNPFCFEPPVAPHLAAAAAGVAIGIEPVLGPAARLAADVDYLVAEGAGGWLVPLSGEQDMADLAVALGLPVIMVVGMRLGCINHARLTARAIEDSGLPLAGWVANCVDPDMANVEENIKTLIYSLPSPLLGTVPFVADIDPDKCMENMGFVSHLLYK